MASTHETFGSTDSHGMLGGSGGSGGGRKSSGRQLKVRGRSAKHTSRTTSSTHPRLHNMGAPIVLCTTQQIQSGNTSIVKRNCTVDSSVMEEPMTAQLSQLAMEEPTKSRKRSVAKTRRVSGKVRPTGTARRTKKR